MMTDIMSLVKLYNQMSTDELKITYNRLKNEIASAYRDLSTTVIFDDKVDYNRWGIINHLISILSERTTAIEMILNHRGS